MKYIINNKKSSTIIIITIIIIIIFIIYFNTDYILNYKYYNNVDNFDNISNINNHNIIINDIPITNGLFAVYNVNSYSTNNINILKDLTPNKNNALINGPILIENNYLTGTVDTSIEFPKNILPKNYTLFHIAKYNGINKGRIFSGITNNNWLSGFSQGKVGVAYHNGWLSINSNLPNNWILSTDQNDNYRANLNNYTTGKNSCTTNLAINSDKDRYSRKSDWAIACIIVYNRKLTLNEILKVEKYLISKYNNLLVKKKIPEEPKTIYKDNIINLSSLMSGNVENEEKSNKNILISKNSINIDDTLIDINQVNKILNIKTNDDIELLMVDSKFRLRVNLPLLPPYIKGIDFDVNNGINPNYFYLCIIDLDSNCDIYDSLYKCEKKYIDNKDCNNKLLNNNIDNSYRLVLIPGIYALDNNLPFNNIDFTLVKFNDMLYLQNINTGYFPKLFMNNELINLYGSMINDNKSNIIETTTELKNTLCNKTVKSVNLNDKTLKFSCSLNNDSKLYLLTTKNINTSSPINIDINSGGTINIGLNKYDINGNIDNSFIFSSFDNSINKNKYIEKKTTKNLQTYLLNLVSLNSNKDIYSLNFTVELNDFSKKYIINSNINNL